MYKLWVSIKKEFFLLASDRIGLALMFLMPTILVFLMTIVQDSTFRLVNENKMDVLVVNNDQGEQGAALVELLRESKMFVIETNNGLPESKVPKALLEEDKIVALYIPEDFSERLESKARRLSGLMLEEFGLEPEAPYPDRTAPPPVTFYHDPVLQENYTASLVNVVHSFLDILESEILIAALYHDLGAENTSDSLRAEMMATRVPIQAVPAKENNDMTIPNATQHNVPAWTIFAMFFMVAGLGGNIVSEKVSGSFMRLKTMPTSFRVVLGGKVIVYMAAGVLQTLIIFSIGSFIFPYLDLPPLSFPDNPLPFMVMIVMSAMAAVSFAMMIGALTNSYTQANGLGSVLVVIFAGLGGIWVPYFVMPDYLQTAALFSPMYWCLEGFYVLFLKGGSWAALSKIILFLFVFTVVCHSITWA